MGAHLAEPVPQQVLLEQQVRVAAQEADLIHLRQIQIRILVQSSAAQSHFGSGHILYSHS